MPTLSVLTLNLWNIGDPWHRRAAVIASALRDLSPDVVCLQEVLRYEGLDQAARLAEPLGYHVSFGRVGDEPYPFGNAILSRWPALRTEVTALPHVGTQENRCAVLSLLDTPHGVLPVCCTHLNWRLDQCFVRVAQVQHLVDFLDAHTDEAHLPAILAGDFNADPDADEIRWLKGLTHFAGRSVYFADAWAVAGDGSPGHTFVRRNPYAAPCREPDRRLDYVFVRGPNARYEGFPIEARVVLDGPGDDDGTWGSDHLGVLARVGL